MPDRNFDPATINNPYNLLALLMLLVFGIIMLRLRAKDIKEDKPIKPKLSTEDVTVQSFQKLFDNVLQRCANLEAKAEKNHKDIEGWFDKYRDLEDQYTAFQVTSTIDKASLKKVIDQQAEQIASLQTEVIDLKKKLSEFVKT